MRETLYSSLPQVLLHLITDLSCSFIVLFSSFGIWFNSFGSALVVGYIVFDNEAVRDLTSRLGADCYQVLRVIGNDLNLIIRAMSFRLIYFDSNTKHSSIPSIPSTSSQTTPSNEKFNLVFTQKPIN
jgi:hypothetical protein